jgi:hypothetical protein
VITVKIVTKENRFDFLSGKRKFSFLKSTFGEERYLVSPVVWEGAAGAPTPTTRDAGCGVSTELSAAAIQTAAAALSAAAILTTLCTLQACLQQV